MLNLSFVTPRVKASTNERRYQGSGSSFNTEKNSLSVKTVQRRNSYFGIQTQVVKS